MVMRSQGEIAAGETSDGGALLTGINVILYG